MKWSQLLGLVGFAVVGFAAGLLVLSFWKRDLDAPNDNTVLTPVTPQEYWNRGQRAFQEGKLAEAESDMRALIEREPKAAGKCWAILAEIALKKDDLKGAEKAYTEVINLEPRSPAALANRGMLRFQLDKKTEGMKDLDKAVELDPKSIEARTSRATQLQLQGKFAEAIKDYDAVLSHQPDLGEVLMARGLAKQYSKDLDGAEKDLAAAAKLQPQRFAVHANLALLLKEKGDEKGAQAAFDAAAKVAPEHAKQLKENLAKVKPASK